MALILLPAFTQLLLSYCCKSIEENIVYFEYYLSRYIQSSYYLISLSRSYQWYLCLQDRFLHLLVTLSTRRFCFLVYSALGEVVSYILAMP